MAGSEESDATGAAEVFPTADRKPAGRGRSGIRSWLRYFLYFAVVFAAGTGAGWYYVGTQFLTGGDTGIPLIMADKGPVKVRPISPGGMEVPDRDKLVYDRMQGNGERPRVERLLPPPETPLNSPVLEPKSSAGEPEGLCARVALRDLAVLERRDGRQRHEVDELRVIRPAARSHMPGGGKRR